MRFGWLAGFVIFIAATSVYAYNVGGYGFVAASIGALLLGALPCRGEHPGASHTPR
jgi:hypothetical protein